MTDSEASKLLEDLEKGRRSRDEVLRAFQQPPIAELGFAQLDTHRELRRGCPEVVFAASKNPAQLVTIASTLVKAHGRVLLTRVNDAQVRLLRRRFPKLAHHVEARCVTIQKKAREKRPGKIVVISAGTSDIPVAEEAAVTAAFMGNEIERIFDVGVSGLHRLLVHVPRLQTAHVIIVVAGMEGALPSVVAGLVSRPVIAVPTSVGYGASFGGLAALLGMLNSCGSGVTVVNIDNGFGAGYAASQINAIPAAHQE